MRYMNSNDELGTNISSSYSDRYIDRWIDIDKYFTHHKRIIMLIGPCINNILICDAVSQLTCQIYVQTPYIKQAKNSIILNKHQKNLNLNPTKKQNHLTSHTKTKTKITHTTSETHTQSSQYKEKNRPGLGHFINSTYHRPNQHQHQQQQPSLCPSRLPFPLPIPSSHCKPSPVRPRRQMWGANLPQYPLFRDPLIPLPLFLPPCSSLSAFFALPQFFVLNSSLLVCLTPPSPFFSSIGPLFCIQFQQHILPIPLLFTLSSPAVPRS